MLACQNFGRSHQRRLPAVLRGKPYAGGSHHGFAAAHIALTQAIHRLSADHVGYGIVNGPLLRPGQGEGKRLTENRQIHRVTGRACRIAAAPAEHGQPAGEQKQLFKRQAAARRLQRFGRSGEMDIFVGVIGVAKPVGAADIVRQYIAHQFTAGVQSLAHGLAQNQLADPGGQGIDRHNASGEHLPPLRLQNGIDHLAADQVTLHFAVKNIGLTGMETAFAVLLIEKDHIHRAAVVYGAHLYQHLAAANTVRRRLGGNHGANAGVFAQHQLANGAGESAVFIGTGEVGDQIAEGKNAQFIKRLGACFSDPLDIAYIRLQGRHDRNPLFTYYTSL